MRHLIIALCLTVAAAFAGPVPGTPCAECSAPIVANEFPGQNVDGEWICTECEEAAFLAVMNYETVPRTWLQDIGDWFQDAIDRMRGKTKPAPVTPPAQPPVVTNAPPPAPDEPKDDDAAEDEDVPTGPKTAPVFSTDGAARSQPGGKHVYNYNPKSSRGTIKTVLKPGIKPHWVTAWGSGYAEELYRAKPNEHAGMWRFYGRRKIAALPSPVTIRIGGLPDGDVYYVVTKPDVRLP